MSNTPLPGPGWHPDPHHPDYLRYWDGRAWTHHTSPLPTSPLPTSPAGAPRRSRSTTAWLVAAVAALALVGVSTLSGRSTPEEASSTSVAPSEPPVVAAAEPEPTTQPTPEVTDVPDLEGVDQSDARRLLDRSGLMVGPVEKVWSRLPTGTVLEQGVRAGAIAALGSTVALVVARTIPSIPGTAGRMRAAAVSVLESAGYRVQIVTQNRTSGTDGAVVSQSPLGGSRLKPGGVVRLVVANVVQPVVQAPAPANCTTGYDPCLPPMSDYDCAGGSGDGPGYTGYVRVTGNDPYDLDSDGDGVACES